MSDSRVRSLFAAFRRDGLLREGASGPTRPVVFLALIGLVASVMTAGSVVLPAGAGAAGSSVGASDGQFVAITPVRVLDTRVGLGAPKALVGGGSSVPVAVTGRAGIPTSGVAAVVLTMTVVAPRAAGYVSVYATNMRRPATSNLNFTAGQTVANLVVAVPGADGKVDVFNGSSAAANLLVDISGYYRTGPAAQPGGYSPVAPVRVLDTRVGLGAPKALVGGGSSVPVAVTGRAGIPTSGVAAVVLTVTVVAPRAAGYVSVFGHSLPRPATSNLNFTAGQTVANLVVAVAGADGKVDLFNGAGGGSNLLVDVSGYYVAPDQYASSQGGPGSTLENPSESALTPANVAGLHPAWNANQMATTSFASPAIVDGIAYIPGRVPGQASGELLAADAHTGQTLWTAPMDCNTPMYGLTVSIEMAFIGCYNSVAGTGATGGVVIAVDLSSHKQVWSRKISVGGVGELSVADGMVITFGQSDPGSQNSSTLGLDAYTGQLRYQIPDPGPIGLTYTAKDGQLVIASGPNFKVYNDATGSLLWTGVGPDTGLALTLDAGRILGSGAGVLSEWPEGGCSKATCAENWTTTFKAASDPRTCATQPGGADGHTIAMTVMCSQEGVDLASSHIVLVDESTGAIANTIPMPAGQMVSAGAVRSGNLLWVPGGQGPATAPYPPGIEAFNAKCTTNCQPVVDLAGDQFSGSPWPSIAVADGTVLIQTWGIGQVFAYRLN
jgi:PQQ-like domain